MRISFALLAVALLGGCSSERKFTGSTPTGVAAKTADAMPEVVVAEVPVPAPIPEPEPAPVPEPIPAPVPEPEPPGEPVEQFGVNFEDSPGATGDSDYNDAVLCFKGSFAKADKLLTSTSKQQVEFTTASDAGCELNIEVTIIRKGVADAPRIFNAKAKDIFLLDFNKGDSINVVMIPVSPACGGPNARREMADEDFGKIEATCRSAAVTP